jgi:V/A-type H+-transporting ATPase subunit I
VSIVPLKKLTLFGLTDEKEQILKRLQKLGCLHLVTLRPAPDRPEDILPQYPKDTHEAMRYLLDSPIKRRAVTEDEDFDLPAIVEKALWNRARLRAARESLDELRLLIRARTPWGNFKLPGLEDMGGLRLWFYVVPLNEMRDVEAGDLTWQVVSRDHRNAYVVVISEEEPPEESMPVARMDPGSQSLAELRREEEDRVGEEEDILSERWRLTRWLGLLRSRMAEAEDDAALRFAATQTLDSDEVFAIQGWVPEEVSEGVVSYANASGLACTIEEPKPSDSPPVLLKNQQNIAAGEDILAFFQLPGYRDWDPSAIVFVSFALFFGMILSDAGYAAVLVLLALFLWKKMGRSRDGKRIRKLVGAVVTCSVVYGVLVGSYFGVTPPEGTFLGRLQVLDINNFIGMMYFSAGIGGLHVLLANVMVAWNRRSSLNALAPLGWVIMVTGGMTFLVRESAPQLWASALWIIVSGGLLVLLFNSDRPFKGAMNLLLRLLDGLKGVAGVTTAFGDVLSYLRLFALGLASASLAVTFNDLATQAMGAGPGVGLLLALMILALGHVLNLVLAVVSGVVHGLRLNLIEFYHWGINEEGYPFNAFRKKETVSWTA